MRKTSCGIWVGSSVPQECEELNSISKRAAVAWLEMVGMAPFWGLRETGGRIAMQFPAAGSISIAPSSINTWLI